jgi:fucose permease
MAQIGQAAGETGTSEDSAYRQIMRIKALHLLAFFILVYVGVEVTIGGDSLRICPPLLVHLCARMDRHVCH